MADKKPRSTILRTALVVGGAAAAAVAVIRSATRKPANDPVEPPRPEVRSAVIRLATNLKSALDSAFLRRLR